MSKVGKCPIWDTKANIESRAEDGRIVVTDSPRAGGGYSISGDAKKRLRELDEVSKVRLTSWLVKQQIQRIKCPDILPDIVDQVQDGNKDRNKMMDQDRQDNLLRYLGKFDAKEVRFKKSDNTSSELLAWTASREIYEVINIAKDCHKLGQIKYYKRILRLLHPFALHKLKLEQPGYARLNELDRVNREPSQAFIAMWFDASMDEAYEEGIKPAIKETGYDSQRIDDQEFTGKIDDQIIAEIRRSRFLVADFTQGDDGARGGGPARQEAGPNAVFSSIVATGKPVMRHFEAEPGGVRLEPGRGTPGETLPCLCRATALPRFRRGFVPRSIGVDALRAARAAALAIPGHGGSLLRTQMRLLHQ